MDRTKRLVEVLKFFGTHAIENCGFCRGWCCAQTDVQVSVGALHRWKYWKKETKLKKGGCMSSRKKCWVVDRREIDEKKTERRPPC